MIPKIGGNKKHMVKKGMGQGQMNLNIDLNSCEDIKCTHCQHELFLDVTKLKYISPLQSPTGKDTVAAVIVGKICQNCGELFNPDKWKRIREIVGKKGADDHKDTSTPNKV
jgi:hypothetical protein